MKFADGTPLDILTDRDGNFQQTGIRAVDALFNDLNASKTLNVLKLGRLLPNENPNRTLKYNGPDVVERDLSRLCLVKIATPSMENNDNPEDFISTYELIEKLKELPEVEFAEPNYIAYALGMEEQPSVSNVETHRSASPTPANDGDKPGNYHNVVKYMANPYYHVQWGIHATGLDDLWAADHNNNSERAVIAILDTGVDITHTDLAANIWTNPGENGNGYDDDNNGFVDDLHGWDFVNQTGDIHDFNSHGTHCAGIAAAVGDNYKGIVGANPKAYIMPVTVLQSNGSGAISTLIQGINYAKNNGADVISMSLGTYAYSIALEQALGQAYQNCVLVAAAGNDGAGIDSRCATPAGQMFPAAFTFVLGVEASQEVPDFSPFGCGYRACYSNYDCDGHSFSQFGEEQLYNYEIMAPGSNIISTVPNGKYKYLNGTSMATPLVAGGISALLHAKDYPSQEMLWGDLINTAFPTIGNVNFDACYDAGPAPAQLQFVNFELNDTLGGDGDYTPDAGEIISLYPTIRTTWGAADNITTWLTFAEYEDQTTLDIIDNNVDFGHSLSAYAKSKSTNPIRFKINENIADDRIICLVLHADCPNAQEEIEFPFTIQVVNGVEIGGIYWNNDTLWPNKKYIVTSDMAIADSATLVIMPGTRIDMNGKHISSLGHLKAIGTLNNMIEFYCSSELEYTGGVGIRQCDTLQYCSFVGRTCLSSSGSADIDDKPYCIKCNFNESSVYNGSFYDCDFRLCQVGYNGYCNHNTIKTIQKSNVYYCTMPGYHLGFQNGEQYNSNYHGEYTFCNNYIECSWTEVAVTKDLNMGEYNMNLWSTRCSLLYVYRGDEIFLNNTIGNNFYLGSSKESIVRQYVSDYYHPTNPYSFSVIDLTNMAKRPTPDAHGVVWKVVVNGYDSQDEFDSIAPLGIGRHKFEVYFNRAMNISVAPTITMGVRQPYTQHSISADGSWSADSTIYTAYLDLDASMVTDGLNRIYVMGAKDNEDFEIPEEKQRFNVQVATAGSMSTGFEATAGIGKIDLEWTNDSTFFADHLGYNMYRYQKDANGNSLDTLLLNNEMITDTIFTDFNVTPGERYYYFYRDMRTDLSESNPSRNVSTIPLTASPGDANGSLSVDVADIVTIVNYISGDNPQPFIFGAADVNNDGEIDVLDIVSIINIINASKYQTYTEPTATAVYSIVDGILYVDTPVELAGVQVFFNVEDDAEIEPLNAMSEFEQVGQRMDDGRYMFLAFSMAGKKLEVGKHALLRIGKSKVDDMILSDLNGGSVLAVEQSNNGIVENSIYIMNQPYPNPFNGSVTIPYIIGESEGNVTFNIMNITGQQIEAFSFGTQSRGEYTFDWQPAADITNGVYLINMVVNGVEVQRNKVVYLR